jgi:hypothetical protein
MNEIFEEMGAAMEELLSSMIEAIGGAMADAFGSFIDTLLDQPIPSEEEVLVIAKKYYKTHKKLIPKEETKEFTKIAGKVKFDGMLYDETRAEELREKAASFSSVSDFAVAAAATAVGWASSYARSADTLARILDEALFIDDGDREAGAEQFARYAIYIEPVDPTTTSPLHGYS